MQGERDLEAAPAAREHQAALERRRTRHNALAGLTAGGIASNEQLTAMTGVLLVLLFAVIGVTILRIGQLIWLHLFVGLLVIGPVLLKLASTGYRFVRYYTHDPVYREKGPPELALRLLAPMLVLTTVAVFVSGVVLLFQGPADRGQLVLIHKVSFIGWLVFVGLHILGHLPGFGAALRAAPRAQDGRSAGGAGRAISIVGMVVAGAVLAIVLIPQFGPWTAHAALAHHHHH